MPSTIRRDPERDYFELRESNTKTTSPFSWSQNYTDPPFFTNSNNYSDSSNNTSPISPTDLSFPSATYTLPSSVEDFSPSTKTNNTKQEDQNQDNFSFGTFEEWMRWDDPSDAALSPTSSLGYFPTLKVEEPMTGVSCCGSTDTSRMEMMAQEEGAIFNGGERMEIESPLFQSASMAMESEIEVPREHLYSTPLSWTRPTLAQVEQQRAGSYAGVLTPEEAERLREIAMPSYTKQQILLDPRSPSICSSPEPEPELERHQSQSHKRKSASSDDEDSFSARDNSISQSNGSSSRHMPVKKTAHNMIEKRYRTNLNDKIAALRDSVPSLRSVKQRRRSGDGHVKIEDGVDEDLQGLEAACKLNKATILSKATEYISHLEKRNRALMKENNGLKERVDAFELLVMGRQGPPMQQQMQQRDNEMDRRGSRIHSSIGGQASNYGGKY